MPRIFIKPESITDGHATLPEAEARRLFRVLRMRPGDSVTLFDGQCEMAATIVSLNAKSAVLKVGERTGRDSEPPISITLGQGMPKGEKLEWVVQKAVELGVTALTPVVMERSVKRPDAAAAEKALTRLRRIAEEAARQSGRLRPPDIPGFMTLGEYLERTRQAELKIIFYEGEKTRGLREVLHGASDVKNVALIVGPEGGLSEEEVRLAVEAGYVPVGLGPRILRSETAGITALSLIQYELGDLG